MRNEVIYEIGAREKQKEKKEKKKDFPPVLQRILNEKIENNSYNRSSWSAAWCTDTIQD